jgi:hypothetical protein
VLQRAIGSLRRGEPSLAVTDLKVLLADEAFSQATDLVDIRARAFSYLAQAQLETETFDSAREAAEQALVLTKQIQDNRGEQEVLTLLRRISAQQLKSLRVTGSIRQHEASSAIQPLMDDGPETSGTAFLLKQSALKLSQHHTEEAEGLAQQVLQTRGVSSKETVIARLLLAHIHPKTAGRHLESAWQTADAADDFNLVQAVAKTAEQLGHSVGALLGPQMTRQSER